MTAPQEPHMIPSASSEQFQQIVVSSVILLRRNTRNPILPDQHPVPRVTGELQLRT